MGKGGVRETTRGGYWGKTGIVLGEDVVGRTRKCSKRHTIRQKYNQCHYEYR
jgi:hypothetical protein